MHFDKLYFYFHFKIFLTISHEVFLWPISYWEVHCLIYTHLGIYQWYLFYGLLVWFGFVRTYIVWFLFFQTVKMWLWVKNLLCLSKCSMWVSEVCVPLTLGGVSSEHPLEQVDWQCWAAISLLIVSLLVSWFLSTSQLLSKRYEFSNYNSRFGYFSSQFYWFCLMYFDAVFLGSCTFRIVPKNRFLSLKFALSKISTATTLLFWLVILSYR